MKLKEFYIKDRNSTTCILPPITSKEAARGKNKLGYRKPLWKKKTEVEK